MPALFRFEVFTPYRPFYAEMVEAISLTLTDGEIGVYANHSPFTAPVVTGLLRVKQQGQWRTAFISGGILEVTEIKTILIVNAAEWPEEIDSTRAEVSGTQAKEEITSAVFKFESDKAREKLLRSQYRIKAAEMGSQEK